MHGSRDKTQHDHAFGYNRVNHDGAEDIEVLAEVAGDMRCFWNGTVQQHRRYWCGGDTDIETCFFQSALQGIHHRPKVLFQFGAGAQQFETLDGTHDHRHRQRFGEDLRTHVVAEVFNYLFIRTYKGTDTGHRFGERREIDVDFVHDILLFSCSCAGFTHGSKTMRIVYEEAEIVTCFEGCDFTQFALAARHSEYAFGDHKDATTGCFCQLGSALQLGFEAFHVVVGIHETLAHVQAHAIDDAGMRFCVVNDDIVAVDQAVDG